MQTFEAATFRLDDDSGAEPDGAIASVLKYRRKNILNAEEFPIQKKSV